MAIPHDPEAQEADGAAPQAQGDLPAPPLPAARVGGSGHQPDPSGVGALLPDRQLERLFRLREALGGTEGPAARDASPEAYGLRLAEVEYGVGVPGSGSLRRVPGPLLHAAPESEASRRGLITLDAKRTGERSAGNPHAAFEVAGAGDVDRGAGLRPGAKATDEPPDPTSNAPALDPTDGQDPGADGAARPARGPGRCRGRSERRRRADRPVHLGRGRAARRPSGRAVLQRPPARGREPGRGAQAPRRGAAAADPDVRCPVAQPAGRAADDPGPLPGPCPAAVRRRVRSLSRAVPPPARSAGRGLSQRCHRPGASAVARGAAAVSSGSERADDAATARLADAATGREADRAQFGPRRRDRLHAQALGEADAVPASGRCPAGQQRVRAGLEEGDPAPQECPVLQDPERRPRRRPVHEPDLHLPVERGQPVRLPDRVAAARRRARGQPRALDALELPRGAGVSVDDSDHAVRVEPPDEGNRPTESRPCPSASQRKRPQPASNRRPRPSCAGRSPGERKRNWWMSCWNWPRRTAGFSGSSPPGLTWRLHPTNWSPRRVRPSPTRPTSTSGTSTATSTTTTKPTAK